MKIGLALVLVCALLPFAGATPTRSPDSFHAELADLLAHTPTPETTQPHDFIDTMCLSIFATTVPPRTKISRLTPADTPLLIQAITEFCKLHDIPTPRVFLAHDEHGIDLKFCTYDLQGGLLIHKKTFSLFSTRVFRGYLQQTLLRMSKHFSHHKKILSQRQYERTAGLITLGAFNVLALLASTAIKTSTGRFFWGLLQLGLAGGTGAYCYRSLTQRMSTHSYERVSSFHNDEQAREDIFPGNSPEESLQPVFDAPPEHLLRVITDTKAFIEERNAQYAQLKEWETEEREALRQPSDEPWQ